MERTPLLPERASILRSKKLVLVVVSVLLMLDVMLITVVEPVLPGILYEIQQLQQHGLSLNTWFNSLFQPLWKHRNKNGTHIENIYGQFLPQVGLILGLKPGIEVIGNLVVGPVVDCIGHKIPLIAGSVLYTLTSALFAFSPSFLALIIARILQAIASSLSTVAGLALLATVFTQDTERAKASSIAFSGLSFGIIAGFPFGAVTADLFGRAMPFLILGAASLLDAFLRIIIKPPIAKNEFLESPQKKQSLNMGVLLTLCKNKYIFCALLVDFFIHFGLGVVFTTVPTFMQDTLKGRLWQMACVIVLSTSVQFTVQYLCNVYVNPETRWKYLYGSLSVFSLGLFIYPLIGATQNIWFAILPESIIRVSMGMFTATAFRLCASLQTIFTTRNTVLSMGFTLPLLTWECAPVVSLLDKWFFSLDSRTCFTSLLSLCS